MRKVWTSLCFFIVTSSLVFGQNTKIAAISSSYPIKDATVGGIAMTFNLSISYPVGLSASSYIAGSQLNTDIQGFLSSYPSPSDPPEAILSSVLQSLLSKYPQILGGSLIGEIAGQGQSIGGIMIPGPPAGTVSVIIGDYSPFAGLLGLAEKKGTPRSVKPFTPVKPTPAPAR